LNGARHLVSGFASDTYAASAPIGMRPVLNRSGDHCYGLELSLTSTTSGGFSIRSRVDAAHNLICLHHKLGLLFSSTHHLINQNYREGRDARLK
jgi:hypothetical protein